MYTVEDYKNKIPVFDINLKDDQIVLYHGTSCHNESSIKSNGIEWNPNNNIQRNIINDIIDFHAKFKIQDLRGDGYNILASFNRLAFGIDNNSSPIFLTNIPDRCILYASKEYSGGETIRSLRGIYYNLMDYLKDQDTREKYINFKHDDLDELVSDSQIKEFLEKYRSIFDSAINKKKNHSYGIIYAIEFTENDKDNLTGRGIDFYYNGCINSNKIVGMRKISKDINYNPFIHPFSSID